MGLPFLILSAGPSAASITGTVTWALASQRQLLGSTFPHSSGASLQNHAQPPPQYPTSREERDFTGKLAVPAASTFLYLASIFPGESKQSDPFLYAVNFTEAKSLTVGVWRSHGSPKPHQ